ncbi:hypothetical protein ACFTXM_32225 [Streptomyces sp. NPDC056930]|uniref:hypothetical protein n=1 Tax=Streptomyces sp. NPDC056930 TaxID=3345967 RepID=UPI0036311545
MTLTGEQSDQQHGSARVQVDCPGHPLVLGQCKDVAHQLQQLSLATKVRSASHGA